MNLEKALRVVPNFPKPGVDFLDISPILSEPAHFQQLIQELSIKAQPYEFDKIIAIESRGFLLGSALSHVMKKGLVLVRKKGKLPGNTIRQNYALEYGEDCVEILDDGLKPGEKALVLDDVLATGGTAEAACELVKKLGAEVSACLFFIEIGFLKGREKLAPSVESLVVR